MENQYKMVEMDGKSMENQSDGKSWKPPMFWPQEGFVFSGLLTPFWILEHKIVIIRIFVDFRLRFQVMSVFFQHEKDAHRNLAPIDGRTSSQSLFWTLFVKKRMFVRIRQNHCQSCVPWKNYFFNCYPLLYFFNCFLPLDC